MDIVNDFSAGPAAGSGFAERQGSSQEAILGLSDRKLAPLE
jgi:hypothetical protein